MSSFKVALPPLFYTVKWGSKKLIMMYINQSSVGKS